MRKNLFYLSYDFGFLSIHAHEIIANMIRFGCRVSLFIPNDVQPHFNLHRECKVYTIPVISQCNFIRAIIFPLILAFVLIAHLLKTDRPDLIYVRQNYMGLPIILLACLLKIPYFAEVNGLVSREQGKESRTFKQFFRMWLENRILCLANVIVVPSTTLKKRITEFYKISSNKIYAIPNGFNESIFYPRHTRTSVGKILNFTGKDFVVGFIGSMGEWQGIEILKKAILRAISIDPTIKFLVVGDYTSDANMMKMRSGSGEGAKEFAEFVKTKGLEKNVVYHKFVTYESSADFMNCCDLLVAPYTKAYQEFGGGSPMKLYSYLGCGKPVIISDLGELTDSISLKKNNAAYLIPPDDSQALTDAILYLKKNRTICKQYGDNGRSFGLRKRKWSDSSSQILSILGQNAPS